MAKQIKVKVIKLAGETGLIKPGRDLLVGVDVVVFAFFRQVVVIAVVVEGVLAFPVE